MLKRFIFLFITFLSFSISYAQDGNWDVYLAQYEGGPGSVILNMDLINVAPKKELPFILITGVTFEDCDEHGFPNDNEFEKLYNLSDSIELFIQEKVTSELAGTFTHQCERLEYLYLADTTYIRKELQAFYKTSFKEYDYYINLRVDPDWEGYLKFLYPNEDIIETMSNSKVLIQLQQAGDDLTKSRQVDHWLYFLEKSDRILFVDFAKELGYKIENQDKIKDIELPYQLRISRVDYVYPEAIDAITIELRRKAEELNGDYDGWETFVIKEK